MADTIRTIAALQTLLADNATGDIDPQDSRDVLVSLANAYQQLYTKGWQATRRPLLSRGTANDAADGAFITNMYLPEFADAATKERFCELTLPRGYADGDTVQFLLHWTVNAVNTGVVKWGLEYTIAQGYNQGANSTFNATVTLAEEVNISVSAQYRHITTEFTTAIPATILEPDTVLLCRVFRDGAHANDTFAASAFGIEAGLNVPIEYVGAKTKVPDFRT